MSIAYVFFKIRILNLYYEDISFKSSYLHENFPVYTRIAFLSRRWILLATLLYEQLIHLT